MKHSGLLRTLFTLRLSKLLSLMVFIAVSEVCAQPSYRIYVKGNYNTFAMNDLRSLQSELRAEYSKGLGVPANIVSEFPGFYGVQGGFRFLISSNDDEQIFLGTFIDFASTGGRIHYKDYSGEYRFDQTASSWSIGGSVIYQKQYSGLFSIDYQCSILLIRSWLENSFTLRVWEHTQSDAANFHSFSAGIEAGVVPSVEWGVIKTGIAVSYLLSLPTFLEYDKVSDAFLVNSKGNRVTVDWSGFRIGIISSYTF